MFVWSFRRDWVAKISNERKKGLLRKKGEGFDGNLKGVWDGVGNGD